MPFFGLLLMEFSPLISNGGNRVYSGNGSWHILFPLKAVLRMAETLKPFAATCTGFHSCMVQAGTFLIRLLKG